MKWTDAAERVLKDESAPLNYKELARRILSRELVATTTRTPEITLHVSLRTENRRRTQTGIRPRFTISEGEIGLAEWGVGQLEEAFETLAQASEKARRDLLKKLRQLEGPQFEAYLEVLFTGMGYDVTVTGGPDDDGVDLIAELESGVGLQRVGVQAKCLSGKRSVGQIRSVYSGMPSRLTIATPGLSSRARHLIRVQWKSLRSLASSRLNWLTAMRSSSLQPSTRLASDASCSLSTLKRWTMPSR